MSKKAPPPERQQDDKEAAAAALDLAYWYHAYRRLVDNLSWYEKYLEDALDAGMTPEGIRRRIMETGGTDGQRIADQLRAAAHYMEHLRES